jgi:hypothetical protein
MDSKGMGQRAPPPLFDLTKSMDARLVPEASAYCAPMGAASISSVEVLLNQVNENTHTFPVTPPSAGCVIQRSPEYRMEGYVNFTAGGFNPINTGLVPNAVYTGQAPLNTPWPVLGTDFTIAPANPLNLLVNNWQVNINNATSQYNNTGVRDIQQTMTNPKKRAGRGVTYRNPLFARWDDAAGTTRSLGSVADLQGEGDIPPGAYELTWFCPPGIVQWYTQVNGASPWVGIGSTAGVPGKSLLSVALSYPTVRLAYDTNPATSPVPSISWVGVTTAATAGATSVGVGKTGGLGLPYKLVNTLTAPPVIPSGYVLSLGPNTLSSYSLGFVLVDTVQCPPFGFDFDQSYKEQGLWGSTSMLITAQLGTPGANSARWLQGTRKGGLSHLNYASWHCSKASLWFQYLTPDNSAAAILPPRCVLPLMYKQNTSYADTKVVAPGGDNEISVPSYTFSQVADVMLISARPTASGEWTPELLLQGNPNASTSVPFYEADVCAIIPDRTFTQFQYSNITGIMSNMSAQQAVAMSRKNGVEASVAQFGGVTGSGQMNCGGLKTSMAGAVLAVRPGTDFPLPVGVTPGAMGE